MIGITCGEITNIDHPNSPLAYGQSFTYVDAVLHAGGVPLLIPVMEDLDAAKILYSRLDGLLFAGGNDIDPARYGKQPHEKIGQISRKRDTLELQLMDWALTDSKPLLAICRGMHLLNVQRGGTLIQDIPSEVPGALQHSTIDTDISLDFADQQLRIDASSKLAAILGTTEILANSYHHQAVRKLGNGLQATAWAADDIIEGIEDPETPFVIGVQCHPESIESTIAAWQKLFKAFTGAAAAFSAR